MKSYNIDSVDRKILSRMVEDATVSYAELGKLVSLSPPAVHERVKRLRKSGVIERTTIEINPRALDKSLLAFIHVNTSGWGKAPKLLDLEDLPEVEEVHSVAGDTSIVLKVRTEDTQTLELFLARIYTISGVVSTRTYVVLSTYLERSVQINQ